MGRPGWTSRHPKIVGSWTTMIIFWSTGPRTKIPYIWSTSPHNTQRTQRLSLPKIFFWCFQKYPCGTSLGNLRWWVDDLWFVGPAVWLWKWHFWSEHDGVRGPQGEDAIYNQTVLEGKTDLPNRIFEKEQPYFFSSAKLSGRIQKISNKRSSRFLLPYGSLPI